MLTRKQHMDRDFSDDAFATKCHREYHAQFVDNMVLMLVASSVGFDRVFNSDDPHYNDTPLRTWDSMAASLQAFRGQHFAALFKTMEDFPTQAGYVSILKEAARQMVEDTVLQAAFRLGGNNAVSHRLQGRAS